MRYVWDIFGLAPEIKDKSEELSEDLSEAADKIFDAMEKINDNTWEIKNTTTFGPRTKDTMHEKIAEKDYDKVFGYLNHMARMLKEVEFGISVMRQDLDYAYLCSEIADDDYMNLGKRIQKMKKQVSKMKTYLGKDDVDLRNENV